MVISLDNFLDLIRKYELFLFVIFYSYNFFIYGRENKLINMYVYIYLKNVNNFVFLLYDI